ncbi:MAG: class I SAM-dependent methyltransferase [Clostridia bacterium]|nr:class I SAM-dependent methyltransferase [Clostridia bacterium]MBQ6859032.1 class I SAM-dependent methyltransferase [Clostridia bacterium]MBQ7051934.1 class I SAM-dependent methyltransferase [Clostridia bacterium]
MSEHYYTSAPTSEHEERSFRAVFAGRVLAFDTDAGVFSKQHVDPGSELLCKSLPQELSGRVLDMGCGWGAMTVMTLAKCPGVTMTMADVNERALSLAVSNVAKNHMQAEAVLSDGFERIEGLFDAVITNPPIRAGKAVIYRMFEDAKAHLVPGGVLYLVIRKQQGAPSALKFLKSLYAKAEVIERDGGYWIIACTA